MLAFSKHEPNWQNESGTVSMLFILGIVLLLIFFFGTLEIVKLTQMQIATQARLDACAVRLSTTRMNILKTLVSSNQLLQSSRYAIYAARGAKLIPVANVFAGLSEAALVKLHQSIGLYQNARLKILSLIEIKNSICNVDPFSSTPAYCKITPNLIAASERDRALFPDLSGNLFIKPNNTLGQIYCFSTGLSSKIFIHGNKQLSSANFSDTYEK